MASRATPELKTKQRSRIVAWMRQTSTHCHLCGYPIPRHVDPQRDPLSFTVDEIIPRSHGGSATDPGNLAPAHRTCNSRRQTRPITDALHTECRQAIQPHFVQVTASRDW